MNLKELRKTYRELSGRFDLVNEDYSDSGMNLYINAGQEFLDRLDETQKSWATRFASIALDGMVTTFARCRAIKEVWASSPTEGRWQLEKKDLQDLMEGYLKSLPAEMTSGIPLYYSPCITRIQPSTDTVETYEDFFGYVTVADGNYNAIVINVPTSEAISLIIKGLFYSDELVADDDTSYWSDAHPMLLYMSTMRQVEVVNRSTQGVNDWTNAIATEMKQLGFDLVEELIAEVDQMEG